MHLDGPVQHLEQALDAIFFGFELRIAIVAHENGQKAADIFRHHFAAIHRFLGVVQADCFVGFEQIDERGELVGRSQFLRFLDGVLEQDGPFAIFGLRTSFEPLGHL